LPEKQKQREVYNVIYHIPQGIVATGFKSGETFGNDFNTNLLLKAIFHYAIHVAQTWSVTWLQTCSELEFGLSRTT